jgi:RNA polymerase sigma-70 factor, ECF subfamily
MTVANATPPAASTRLHLPYSLFPVHGTFGSASVYNMVQTGNSIVNNAHPITHAYPHDDLAWEAFIAEHQQAVFRLSYLLLGDPNEAEDVAQETFVRAWNATTSFDHNRPARPWLLQIAANLARNRRRSAGRYLHALGRLMRFGAPPPATIAERSMEHWEAQTLWEAVQQLSVHDQQIIYLRYFLELSETETAQTLGVAHGTAKSRLSRALERLRRVIATDFPALKEERG